MKHLGFFNVLAVLRASRCSFPHIGSGARPLLKTQTDIAMASMGGAGRGADFIALVGYRILRLHSRSGLSRL